MTMMTEPSFLYIDDDPISREVLKILLETVMGFEQVRYFADSRDFMERLRALPMVPTVIFLGIEVTPHNGYEMLAAIRQDPRYQETKIIAVTAYVMVSDVEKMKAANFTGLISKPIIHRIFPDLLQKILAGEPVWYIS